MDNQGIGMGCISSGWLPVLQRVGILTNLSYLQHFHHEEHEIKKQNLDFVESNELGFTSNPWFPSFTLGIWTSSLCSSAILAFLRVKMRFVSL